MFRDILENTLECHFEVMATFHFVTASHQSVVWLEPFKMESVLVDEFIEQTGCDTPDVAYHYLQTNNWNVSSAVQDFRDAVNDGFAESSKSHHFLVLTCNI